MLTATQVLDINPGIEHEAKIIIGNEVFFYNEKKPYLNSGYSIKGALEYDSVEDKVKCHECGLWFRSIGSHLRYCKKAKKLSAREYKIKHGFGLGAALISEGTRKKYIEVSSNVKNISRLTSKRIKEKKLMAGKLARVRNPWSSGIRTQQAHNRRRICRPQILFRIKELAKQLGRTPTQAEMNENGIYQGMLRFHFGGGNKAILLAGLRPNAQYVSLRWPFYTKKGLCDLLKNFYSKHGRRPSKSDMRRGLLPGVYVFKRHFGSYTTALQQAKIPLEIRWETKMLSKKEMINRLHDAGVLLKRKPSRSWEEQKFLRRRVGVPNWEYYSKIFGSWEEALKLAGLDGFPNKRKLSKSSTRNQLLISLKEFVSKNGRNPKTDELMSKNRLADYQTFVRHFGSWKGALKEAGLT